MTETQTDAEKIAELEASFDLCWAADMRAIKRWQAATGRDLTWPDHADMVVWLLEQLDAAEARLVKTEPRPCALPRPEESWSA